MGAALPPWTATGMQQLQAPRSIERNRASHNVSSHSSVCRQGQLRLPRAAATALCTPGWRLDPAPPIAGPAVLWRGQLRFSIASHSRLNRRSACSGPLRVPREFRCARLCVPAGLPPSQRAPLQLNAIAPTRPLCRPPQHTNGGGPLPADRRSPRLHSSCTVAGLHTDL